MVSWRDDASAKLASISGLTVQDFCHCDFGRENNSDCVSVLVLEEKTQANPFQALVGLVDGVFGNPRARKNADALLLRLRKELPAGLVSFVGTTRWLGEFKPHGVELVVGPGESQFEIIRHARADAVNYDITSEDIIKKLKQYDEQFGIDIRQAETDTIQFQILRQPADLEAFASDLYEFCPDLVDQGCGSIPALLEELKQKKDIVLWWD